MRWTEKRNFEAVLNAISKKILDVQPLITERVSLNEYKSIYGDMNNPNSIASILVYDNNPDQKSVVVLDKKSFEAQKGVLGIVE